MVSFLYRIAQVYYQQFDSEISRFTFVFPNRRAGIFFRYYLSTITDKPVFSPEILTIDECFASASNYQLADRLSNLFKIYKIYKELSKSDETFDSFVFWGEMLLNDFEDIDKYKVDARQLFTNITELKEIDQLFNVFSEKQLEAIRQFWKNFVPVIEGKTSEEFISIWKILYSVYEQFHAELKAEGTATEGMICRDVVERLNNRSEIEAWNDKQFVFIGFNALNPCEKSLMSALQKRGQADFYWDYEANELRDINNPASYFFAENTSVFPSKFSIEPIVTAINEKDIQLIAVPSAVGQTRQVYSILNNIYPETDQNTSWINTAVVLPDENLLVPLLHAIPEQIRKVNVTMGYPMNVTPVSGLIEHIFDLQKRLHVSGEKTAFYFQSVMNIINHQYITLLAENEVKAISSKMIRYNWVYVNADELTASQLLSTIFTPQTDPKTFLSYLLEIMNLLQEGWKKREVESSKFSLESDFLYQYYISINRIDGIIKNLPEVIDLSIDTLIKLIRQLTSGITIPFVGEPLEGLQIMGVLETRGIDFDNLIITSFNEGVYPKKNASNSFIPYNLRRGFSLPTFD
jgi:Fe-S-cluster formation regulator IscX/YfhJ